MDYIIYCRVSGLSVSARIPVPSKQPRGKPPQEIQDEMVQDPVCQVYLPKRGWPWSSMIPRGKRNIFAASSAGINLLKRKNESLLPERKLLERILNEIFY